MTPADYLTSIVLPTLAEFNEEPDSPRRAYLACITASHLADYVALAINSEKPDRHVVRQTVRRQTDYSTAALAIVDGISNGTKHGRPGDRSPFKWAPGSERRREPHEFTIGHIAALAGVGRSTVQHAVRQAAALGILTSEEWRLTAWRSAPNTVRIISPGGAPGCGCATGSGRGMGHVRRKRGAKVSTGGAQKCEPPFPPEGWAQNREHPSKYRSILPSPRSTNRTVQGRRNVERREAAHMIEKAPAARAEGAGSSGVASGRK